MIAFGNVPVGSVLPIPFASYAKATGASIVISAFAVTDVEIYKGTSMTQRASDAGVALMDTDGIDLDGTLGINGFSIDTGDDTTAGFYAVGAFCWVVVSAITIDGETVNFLAATFRLAPAETVAGVPKVDLSHVLGVAELAVLGGTATSGGSTTGFIDSSRAETTNDHWKGWMVEFTSTTLVGQAPICTAYNGTTKAFTFSPAVVTSVVTHTYRLWPGYMAVALAEASAVAAIQAGLAVQTSVDDLEGRLTAALATTLQAHGLAVGRLVVDAGSSTTTVVFKTVNGAAASAADNFYNGRVIIYTSGGLTLQAAPISDYVGSSKTATVPTMTGTPADNDTAVIV